MIRSVLIVLGILFIQLPASAQLKKTYFGKYAGTIASYEINTGVEKIKVAQTPIEVQLSEKELLLKVGNQEMKGTWAMLFEAKAYYVLTGKMENQVIEERIIVYKKGKKISREGARPQPDAMLEKTRK